MANFLFDALSPVRALLFRSTDTLSLGPSVRSPIDISLTTDGVTTTIASLGTSVGLPSLAFSSAANSGNVTFTDGTFLMAGTAGDDEISGTDRDEAIYGMSGNDRIAAADGDDYAFGGSGSDTIAGGSGNDHLYGHGTSGLDGGDRISGDGGNDYIHGNAGSDTLDGGDGDDRILGGADDDLIFGGAGNDAINGNFGNDRIDGGDGNDVLRGGKGSDTIVGGAGNDVIHGDLGTDQVTGGAGADIFRFGGNDAAIVDVNGLIGNVDTVMDFTDGVDRLSLGFVPSAVMQGSVSGTLLDAFTYARQLLSGDPASGHVAAVGFGSDTLLFYNTGGGVVGDSVIDLKGVDVGSIGIADFL